MTKVELNHFANLRHLLSASANIVVSDLKRVKAALICLNTFKRFSSILSIVIYWENVDSEKKEFAQELGSKFDE